MFEINMLKWPRVAFRMTLLPCDPWLLRFGYSQDELATLPEQANMGLSCGNPLALASVSPGEVVVDLGCGGGMDVFLAAQKVGPMGKVIGIDMTSEMLDRARAGVAKLGLEECRVAPIHHRSLAH